MNKKVYLACPYSSFSKNIFLDRFIKWRRFRKVSKKAGELMDQGYIVFSPLSHSHPIQKLRKEVDAWKFWKRQDFSFILWCDEFHILCLEGWEYSKGIRDELAFAKLLKKKIVYHYVQE